MWPNLLSFGLLVLLTGVMLTGFWMLFQRLRLMEDRVREVPQPSDFEELLRPVREQVSTLKEIRSDATQALRRLDDLPEAIAPDELARQLEPMRKLQGALKALEQRLEKVHRELAQKAQKDEVSHDKEVGPLSLRLQHHLEQDGFDRIKVLLDLESANPVDEHRVPVEARRHGASYKGVVTLAEGRVKDVALRPCYEAFP